jgi:hypothetical protein
MCLKRYSKTEDDLLYDFGIDLRRKLKRSKLLQEYSKKYDKFANVRFDDAQAMYDELCQQFPNCKDRPKRPLKRKERGVSSTNLPPAGNLPPLLPAAAAASTPRRDPCSQELIALLEKNSTLLHAIASNSSAMLNKATQLVGPESAVLALSSSPRQNSDGEQLGTRAAPFRLESDLSLLENKQPQSKQPIAQAQVQLSSSSDDDDDDSEVSSDSDDADEEESEDDQQDEPQPVEVVAAAAASASSSAAVQPPPSVEAIKGNGKRNAPPASDEQQQKRLRITPDELIQIVKTVTQKVTDQFIEYLNSKDPEDKNSERDQNGEHPSKPLQTDVSSAVKRMANSNRQQINHPNSSTSRLQRAKNMLVEIDMLQ